jgi:hypothetical protein
MRAEERPRTAHLFAVCQAHARAPGRGLHTHYSIEIAETVPMADPASRLGSLKGFIRCKALVHGYILLE